MKGLSSQKPQNWKNFPCNEEIKQKLVELMFTCRSYISYKHFSRFLLNFEKGKQMAVEVILRRLTAQRGK